MKYKTEKEILDVIKRFENGTVKRGNWGHPEHLIVAYHYAANNDFETALEKMKDGIFNLLRAFEVDLSKEMPYHETLTIFWMRTIYDFAKSKNGKNLVGVTKEMLKKFDKFYPSKFYTHEHLFSESAKKTFVKPDLKDLQ